MHIVDLSDPAAARASAFDEPNYQAGLYRHVLLHRWRNIPGRNMWEFATNTAVTSDGIYQDVNLTINAGDTFCGSAQVATQGATGGASGNFVIWLIGASQTNSITPLREPARR